MPYINRYLTYLQRNCGLLFVIDKSTWKTINMLGDVRNRYIHRIGKDLPSQIQEELDKLIESHASAETKISDQFVQTAFSTIGSMANYHL